jgi:hypothetical protein
LISAEIYPKVRKPCVFEWLSTIERRLAKWGRGTPKSESQNWKLSEYFWKKTKKISELTKLLM